MVTMNVLFLLLVALALPLAPRVASSEPLAEVDGQGITSEEVEQALGASLPRLQEQLYTLKRQKVQALIDERLLAKEAARRGISVAALLDGEGVPKGGVLPEQEIERFYQANKGRLRGDEATAREQIRAYLQNQKLQAQREAYLKTLRSQAKIVVHLKPPPISRAEVGTDGAPFKGGATAPVTIVEFQDFHCPFCKRVPGTIGEPLARPGGKVKVVHRDFPIDQLHPPARKGHQGARGGTTAGEG